MEQTCPTVKVAADNEQGFIVINESDFDAAAHALFGDAPSADGAPKPRGKPGPKPKVADPAA